MNLEFGYSEKVIVRTHEVDRDKKITVPSLLKLMQEASMQNVLQLRASVWDMEEMKISWVLIRKELTVVRRPKLGESVTIITYPAGFDRVFAYRDFLVYDEEKNLIAYAGSTWTLLNTVSRKMERIPKSFYVFNPSSTENFLKKPENRIESPTKTQFTKTYEVAYFDLDWNGHVNNNVLSRLILQSLPDSYLMERVLKTLIFHIKAECFFKDILEIQFDGNGVDNTLHRIVNKEDNKTIALAHCQWH